MSDKEELEKLKEVEAEIEETWKWLEIDAAQAVDIKYALCH
jgi:hypothetical protein